MKTIGQFLKENRLNRNLSLDEAAQKLAVRKPILQNLEEDAYEKLPAEVYLKGLIKKYARLLQIDTNTALALFRRSYSTESQKTPSPPQPLKKTLITITPGRLASVVISLVILVFLGFLFWQYRSYTGKPLLVVTSPTDQATIYQEYIEVTGKTDPDATLYINGQESHISEDGSFSVAIGLNPGMNSLTIIARKQSGKESVEQRQVEVVTETDS